MITSIVFDVDDTIYDQQAPYRIAMEKCFPDFDMTHMNQAYIRFRHYSDIGFPRVMTGEWTTEYFRFWRCKETLLEFGYHEIDEEMGNHFQEVYEHELENITMLDEMRMTLDFLKEKRVLIVHGGGFNWYEPDHFRIVYLPRVEVLSKAMENLGDFLATYHQK